MNEIYLGRGHDRRMLPLGKLLGEGAAGKVYSVPALPGAAAKLYHGSEEARAHEAKVEAMIANPPDLPHAVHERVRYPQIAWPQAKLFDRSGRFIGFLMPEIDFRRSTSLVNLLQKNSRRIEKLSEYYGYRVLVARNLASVFAELHRAGHHMIDMKPANLRFYPQVSWMAVVDTDGFSISGSHGRLAATQVSDEYIAPEGWKRPIGELGVEQDLFALAVIIFQLLDNGVHPFAGGSAKGQATDLQARILDGVYPYALKPAPGLTPSTASVHRMFKRATRELFDRAFLPGRARPSAEEWREHLDLLLAQLVPCAAKPDEHVHFGSGCGFCAHEARVAVTRAKPQADRRPRPGAVPLQPGALAVPMPGGRRPGVRPVPIVPGYPVNVQFARPQRRRRGLPWRGLGVLAAAGVVIWATSGMWQPLFTASAVPPLELYPAPAAPPPADVAAFAEPREYLVLPRGGSLSVPMHRGPGEDFPEIDRLSLHDAVIGKGTSQAKDGSTWIYVTRDSDGMTGFVPEVTLLERKNAEAELRRAVPDDDNLVVRRFRAVLDASEGYERAYLNEQQKLWEEDRARCAMDINPAECRDAVDTRRLSELDSWADTARQSGRDIPEFNRSESLSVP